jgi:hypothetical protein
MLSIRRGFFEFIPIHDNKDLIVVHELGIVRTTVNGSILWSVDTEIVEDWKMISNHELHLSEIDNKQKLSINVETGRTFRTALRAR